MSNSDLKARAELLVPDHARDNYDQMARDIANQEGISPKEAMGKLVAGWRQQHERYPLSGYDVLAAWGEDRDPGDGKSDPAVAALTRAVESAKREPSQYLDGHPEVREAAELALKDRADTPAPESTVKNAGPANLAGASVEKATDSSNPEPSGEDEQPKPAARRGR